MQNHLNILEKKIVTAEKFNLLNLELELNEKYVKIPIMHSLCVQVSLNIECGRIYVTVMAYQNAYRITIDFDWCNR